MPVQRHCTLKPSTELLLTFLQPRRETALTSVRSAQEARIHTDGRVRETEATSGSGYPGDGARTVRQRPNVTRRFIFTKRTDFISLFFFLRVADEFGSGTPLGLRNSYRRGNAVCRMQRFRFYEVLRGTFRVMVE